MIPSRTTTPRKVGYGAGVLACALAHAALASAQAPATAEPVSVRVKLTVDADARCATRDMVVKQVLARSPRIAFVDAAADAPELRVAIGEGTGAGRLAELWLRWPDGRSSERSLRATGCAAAIDALALLIAMTLDPEGVELAASPPGTPLRDDDGTRAASEPAPATSAATTTSSDPSEPPVAPAAEPGAARATESSEREPTRDSGDAPHPLGVAHVAAGAGVHLLSGAAPRALLGFSLYGRLRSNGAGAWAAALQLQLARTWANGLSQPGGDADFAIESAALDVCPLGLRLAPFEAYGCLASTLGRLTASGSNSYQPRTQHELWGALGGRLLLALGLGDVLELHGGFGLLAPFRRHRFAFRPDVFHQVASLCPEGHLGAGVRFP